MGLLPVWADGLSQFNMSNSPTTKLTTSETKQYENLKKTIRNGLKGFLEVGRALCEIRDRRLYGDEFDSWDQFCRACFDMTRSYASRLVSSAQCVEEMKEMLPIGNKTSLPIRESQVRELLRLETSEERSEAWQQAVADYPNGSPPAKVVREIVEERLPDVEWSDEDSEEEEIAPERVSAILADGSELPEALWINGWANAEYVLQVLRAIADGYDQPTALALQRLIVAIQDCTNGLLETCCDSSANTKVQNIFNLVIKNLGPTRNPKGKSPPTIEESPETQTEHVFYPTDVNGSFMTN